MRKITFLISALLLTACGESTTTDIPAGESHLWDEKQFTISTPAGYERIAPDYADLSLPDNFVVGYSEVRLDDNFANTVTIHREPLNANIISQTYALALRDNVSTSADYAELDFYEEEGNYTHHFQISSTSAPDKLTITQRSFVHNSQGWIISCATVSQSDLCPEIVSSFHLK